MTDRLPIQVDSRAKELLQKMERQAKVIAHVETKPR